jgi:hypothetical protein
MVGSLVGQTRAGIALAFRNYSLEKPPSVSEMIDLAKGLYFVNGGADRSVSDDRNRTIHFAMASQIEGIRVNSRVAHCSRQTRGTTPADRQQQRPLEDH